MFRKLIKAVTHLFTPDPPKKVTPAAPTAPVHEKRSPAPGPKARDTRPQPLPPREMARQAAAKHTRPERPARKERQQQRQQNVVAYQPLPIPPLPTWNPPPEQEGKLRFHDLPLHHAVIGAVQDLGFEYCTPVQTLAIPKALEGKDLIGKAQTGTGKTAAFLTVIFSRFLNAPLLNRQTGTPRALVLAPTRELAIQIHQDAQGIGKYCGLHCMVVFGGMDHQKQLDLIQKNPIDILIGTPGRIIDYMQSGALKLNQVEVLVIDEADRMLDMGFIPDVSRIVSRLPQPGTRQTFFFSATFTPEVMRLADRWLHNPEHIEIPGEHAVTDLIDQRFYSVLRQDKFALLHYVLTHETYTRVLIFGNRRDYNFDLADRLKRTGIACELLSGDVPQDRRLKILDRFRSGATKILVATDVAARGIHVEGISHVINYDLPEQGEDYIHRIGRTGRAGEKGTAISFICEYGAYCIDGIEKAIGNAINSLQPSDEMLVPPKETGSAPEKSRRPGRSNNRRR